jgi:outer membrane protein OmpA-like peptidoglycan-associated protein
MRSKLYAAFIAMVVALALPAAGWAADVGCTTNKAGGSPGPYRIEFAVGSAAIGKDNAKALDEAAYNAKSRYAKVCLTGSADQQGNKQANYTLSIRRAEAVKAALQKRGVAAKSITIVGKGAPLADQLRIASDSPSDRSVVISLQ